MTLCTLNGTRLDVCLFLQRLVASNEPCEDDSGDNSDEASAAPKAAKSREGTATPIGENVRQRARFLAIMEPVRRSRSQLAFDENMNIVWADAEFARIHSLPRDFVTSMPNATRLVRRQGA